MRSLLHQLLLLLIAHTNVYILCEDIQGGRNEDHKQRLVNVRDCKRDVQNGMGFLRNDDAFNSSVDSEMNDIVQRQYLMLPYPPFTKRDLKNEEKYYQSSKDVSPLLFSFLIQLEYINHYLFQGKNNFL